LLLSCVRDARTHLADEVQQVLDRHRASEYTEHRQLLTDHTLADLPDWFDLAYFWTIRGGILKQAVNQTLSR
jgi:hypothetical protein